MEKNNKNHEMQSRGEISICKEIQKLIAPLDFLFIIIKFNMNLTFVYILFIYV